MFKIALAATDLVASSDTPVSAALEIVKQNNGKLYLLHVLESASSHQRQMVKHFKTGEEIAFNIEYQKQVEEKIRQTYAESFKFYRHYELKVTIGYPFEEILSWAAQIGADLIVIGPHSSRAEDKGVVRIKGKVGSTTEGVIMNERCPVMIVSAHMPPQRLQFKKLMVGIDFSGPCVCAFQFALRLSRNYGSKIFVYHMLPVPPSSQYSQAMYKTDVKNAHQKLEKLCGAIPSGIDYECKVWGGVHPHLEILRYANKNDVDTIIMGSHTKEKGGTWYVGSAVERVSHRATCPVMVVTDAGIFQFP